MRFAGLGPAARGRAVLAEYGVGRIRPLSAVVAEPRPRRCRRERRRSTQMPRVLNTADRGVGVDALSDLLQRALAAKRAQDGPYRLEDLQRDADVNFTWAWRVVNGKGRPSRAVVVKIARALSPYIDSDLALLSAGYLPDDPTIAEQLQTIGAALILARNQGQRGPHAT